MGGWVYLQKYNHFGLEMQAYQAGWFILVGFCAEVKIILGLLAMVIVERRRAYAVY
jgi:hypothetical protein